MNYLILGKGANMGDLGIAAATVQDILRNDPAASIVYLCDRPDEYAELTELEGHTVGPFEDISLGDIPNRLPRILRVLLFTLRLLVLRWSPGVYIDADPAVGRVARHHQWADVVVRQGGPGWNDWVLNRKVLRVRLAYMALALHYRVPVVKFAQSFGPFEWAGIRGWVKRSTARFILNRARLLTLRDTYSRPALDRLGVVGPRIEQAADAAWNLQSGSRDQARERLACLGVAGDIERPRIGLTLRSMHGGYGVSEREEQELICEFAVFCDHVSQHLGKLVFLSTDYRDRGKRNDLDVIRLVQEQMDHPDCVHVIEEEFPPAELKALYGEMDATVSVRLHPAIFAMSSGVPTLFIGYDPKCWDVCKQLGWGEWYMDIHGWTAEEGIQRMHRLMARRRELNDLVQSGVNEAKDNARRSVEAMSVLLESVSGDRQPRAGSGAPPLDSRPTRIAARFRRDRWEEGRHHS